MKPRNGCACVVLDGLCLLVMGLFFFSLYPKSTSGPRHVFCAFSYQIDTEQKYTCFYCPATKMSMHPPLNLTPMLSLSLGGVVCFRFLRSCASRVHNTHDNSGTSPLHPVLQTGSSSRWSGNRSAPDEAAGGRSTRGFRSQEARYGREHTSAAYSLS